MITKIQKYKFTCDNCNKQEIFYNGFYTHIESARNKGWAIAKNRINCYCPECAPYFRNAGKQTSKIIWEMKKKEK